jgi:hypothetical protein
MHSIFWLAKRLQHSNIPDQVRIDWDEPAFDIYSPKSRLIAVSVRSSSVRSVTLWFNFVTLTPIEWGIQNININPTASSLNNKII